MNIVDSSCWLEYFAGSNVGEQVASVVQATSDLVVPAITLYEVFKKLLIELDEDRALLAVAHMKQGQVVSLDGDMAIYAAKLGRDLGLAMANSTIYATAQRLGCTLWTQDAHFRSLSGVRYFEKGKSV
jgi:predicted nucleic acid-binding protein